jgi:hypothetical protein
VAAGRYGFSTILGFGRFHPLTSPQTPGSDSSGAGCAGSTIASIAASPLSNTRLDSSANLRPGGPMEFSRLASATGTPARKNPPRQGRWKNPRTGTVPASISTNPERVTCKHASLQTCRGLRGPPRALRFSPALRTFDADFDVVNHLVARDLTFLRGYLNTSGGCDPPCGLPASLCTLRPCCFALLQGQRPLRLQLLTSLSFFQGLI